MTALRIATLVFLALGAWRSVRAMGPAVHHGGRRYYRQPDGRYRRWYGGHAQSPEEIGL